MHATLSTLVSDYFRYLKGARLCVKKKFMTFLSKCIVHTDFILPLLTVRAFKEINSLLNTALTTRPKGWGCYGPNENDRRF